ncbi:MAG: cell division protein FtsX [Luteibaculaceae bacterium]
MASSTDKLAKRRARGAYVSTVIGISLVLFMLGSLLLLLLNAQKLSVYIKENITFQLFLKDDLSDTEIQKFITVLEAEAFVKESKFVSAEEAAKELQDELGEDFIDFLGFNPLKSVIEISLRAPFAEPDSIAWIAEKLQKSPRVTELHYNPNLVEQVSANISKISLVLLGFTGLLLIIASALINNTIRLSIYAKRFLIRTMQLVGASPWFIRKPFLGTAILQGIVSGLLAMVMLMGLIAYVQKEIPELVTLQDLELFLQLFVLVILLGVLISIVSVYFAVNKYLRMKPENLYG